jgi:transposase
VQSAVDTKHHLIVEHDVTMTVDRGKLTLVASQVKKTLGKKNITIIGDKGYFSRNDIKATQDLGMTANVPQTDTSGSKKKGIFNKSLFKYDKDQDMYVCPAGEVVPHRRNVVEHGLEQKVYVNHIACRDCEIHT